MTKLKKQLWSLARLALPAVGFALTSSGAYLVSLENPYDDPLMAIPAYVMIILGLFSMLTGVFWNVCQSMKSKVYHRGAHQRQVHIFTIDRPSSFPPSYEQSQNSQHFSPRPQLSQQSTSQLTSQSEVVLDIDGPPFGLAPPLYSQDSSEAPDCSWSWERPPRYSQVEKPRDPTPAP